MSQRAKEIREKLGKAHYAMSGLIEDVGNVLMHLREGVTDANEGMSDIAELSAGDALELLSHIKTKITEIEDVVATCTS
jgi:hypothetical protein